MNEVDIVREEIRSAHGEAKRFGGEGYIRKGGLANIIMKKYDMNLEEAKIIVNSGIKQLEENDELDIETSLMAINSGERLCKEDPYCYRLKVTA